MISDYRKLLGNAIVSVLDKHIPSLTEDNEDELAERVWDMAQFRSNTTMADLALRTCACGVQFDGFYEYVDHLREVFRSA